GPAAGGAPDPHLGPHRPGGSPLRAPHRLDGTMSVTAPAARTLVGQTRVLLPRRSDWTVSRPRRDLVAGVTVAIVALPLALAFGVTSGLGARAGLVTAVIAGC